jgi:hypothetical protein
VFFIEKVQQRKENSSSQIHLGELFFLYKKKMKKQLLLLPHYYYYNAILIKASKTTDVGILLCKQQWIK